jgi:hypothetical protein
MGFDRTVTVIDRVVLQTHISIVSCVREDTLPPLAVIKDCPFIEHANSVPIVTTDEIMGSCYGQSCP